MEVRTWLSLLLLAVAVRSEPARILQNPFGSSAPLSIPDMDWNTFEQTYLNKNMGKMCRYDPVDYDPTKSSYNSTIPFEVNWGQLGVLPVPRDQKACNASWVFASVAAIESHAAISSGDPLRSFSAQMMLDCLGKNSLMACRPGTPTEAFNFVQKNGGLSLDSLYKNKSLEKKDLEQYSTCKFSLSTSGVVVNGGSKDIKPFDEATLLDALLTQGPVAVMIDAKGLKTYSGGIWDGTYVDSKGANVKCSEDQASLNHVALVVGVEHDPSTKQTYYTLLNSWGSSWGENGYFRLLRRQNICGLALCAAYPKLTAY